jgi:hypothetical protein
MRNFTKPLSWTTLSAWILVAGLSGCRIRDSLDTSLGEAPDSFVEAQGWEGVLVSGVERYMVEVKLKPTGHFEVDKNLCRFRPESGPFEIGEWNALASAMNRALASPPVSGSEPLCVPLSRNTGMDDKVYLTRDLERLPFFEVKGIGGQREACTFRIADPAAAKEVADRIDAAASLAAHEGCPSRG